MRTFQASVWFKIHFFVRYVFFKLHLWPGVDSHDVIHVCELREWQMAYDRLLK